MICLTRLSLATLCFSFCGILIAAEAAPDAPRAQMSSAATSLAGLYVGTWGSGPDGGQLRLKLKQDASLWSAEVSFTVGETQVTGKVVSLTVAGHKLEMVVDWQLESTSGQSRITGGLSGDKLDGTYESKTLDGTSSGTWSVTRA
ncbi:MAG: hypothetical protein ABIV50_04900 [Opitutus sp.]